LKEIYIECPQCGGTGEEYFDTNVNGQIVHNTVTCRRCLGSTTVVRMNLNNSFITIINDIKDSLDIIKPQIQALYDDLNP
jgi:uncharacterized Zn finger protein